MKINGTTMVEEKEIERLKQILMSISAVPGMGYFMHKPPIGMTGCMELSAYLTSVSLRVTTDSQKESLLRLSKAYESIVKDLNEAYMVYLMYCNMKKRYSSMAHENEILKRENEELKKEIEKLYKTLKFE